MKKLNLGCGRDIRTGYLNADKIKSSGVNKVVDFDVFPWPFAANSFDEVYADNVLEHLGDVPRVMTEISRITKSGGTVRIIVPYYHCYGAYNDVTHRHFFSHLAFEPFYRQGPFSLVSLKFVPTRLGKFIPSSSLRLALSHIFGQLIQTLDLTLKNEKNCSY